ncbi:hypothetical protein CNEO4_560013 [Clostridium neonatale]|nr:hypothetical protein CNEO3_290064 [Clostridium neonatale]CAI3691469.1 hypothetical protein CNEO4_560013 [Clostridium neonatale]CAI3693240.1 hypothetical protein CNEO4_560014 [Clostridium neonatale]
MLFKSTKYSVIKIKINMRCILIEHQTAHWDKKIKIKIKINMRCI